MTPAQPPLVIHLLYRLDFGGLESLLVDCVNQIPPDQFRHAIVCLTDYSQFSEKITRADVPIYALHKPAGLAPTIHYALWKLFRQLRPAILHTYNLAAIEYNLTAKLAGVPICLHAEHGRYSQDPQGRNVRHNLLRRRLAPCIDRYVSVSTDLQRWLTGVVGIPEAKQQLIANGVDTGRFYPQHNANSPWTAQHRVIGSVGQLGEIKNHGALIRAFGLLLQEQPQYRDILRLSIIGAGALMADLKKQIADAGLTDLVWLPGARSDIPALMAGFSVFALPSRAEGTPVALLEAMASSLPVVATRVGGIPEVIADQLNGTLVDADNDRALANAIAHYLENPTLAQQHGVAARERIERNYSLHQMIRAYTQLYSELCHDKLH
jgi:sugar transferase (PEP-CTERM/EpsH1 system associated)